MCHIISSKSPTLGLAHLAQLRLGRKPQPVDRVGSHVAPLPELLRRLRERHIRCYSAVDHRLEENMLDSQYVTVKQWVMFFFIQ